MQTMKRIVLSGIVLTALVAAAPAFADTMANFTIDVPGGTTYTFSLPSNPTVSGSMPNYFDVSGVAITITGYGTQTGTTYFSNTVGFGDGGLAIYGLTPGTLDLDYLGPVLFTGSVTDPTFTAGTFTLENDGDPENAADDATVNIMLTPEPGTLVLLGLGLLCLAGAMRRRLPEMGRVAFR